jgi:hypothetical protein
MKNNVGPVAIGVAVVVLVAGLVWYGMKTLGPSQPDVSPANAPGYAKAMMKNGNLNDYVNNKSTTNIMNAPKK